VPLQPGRPLFSIMITVYDRLETVKRAIRSVAAQLAPDMHVEIVNDGSLLRSQLETFLAKLDDDRITLSCTDEPLGHPHIFNHCIERAKGEWVHILHDDDWVDPHLYEHLRQGIDSAPEVGALLCYHRIVGNASTTGRTMYAYPERETAGIIDGWLERIVVDCRLQFSSIVVRRSAYERVGGFSAECGSAFDWEMWKRLAVHFPVWYDPAMLVPIGRGDGSALTDTLQRSGKQTIDSAQTIAISKSYLPPDVAERLSEKASEALALRGLHLARLFSKRHDYEAVVANLNAALRVCPTPAIQRRATQLLQTIYE
ncbi:glycosyltransferase family 2 protein, partial [Pseudomonadota bacterium]